MPARRTRSSQRSLKSQNSLLDIGLSGLKKKDISKGITLWLRSITPSAKKHIFAYLHTQPSIGAVVHIAGKWDLALGINVQTTGQFHSVWEGILHLHIQHIADYAISIYSPIYHYAKSYLTGTHDASPVRLLGSLSPQQIDSTDWKILTSLSKDARISLAKIAHELGLSAEAISHRKKHLEKKGVIQGYRAMIDVGKLGYHLFKSEIRLSSFEHIKKIHAYCHEHPHIYQVNKTIGGETLEIEFHVLALSEMITILENMEELFLGSIERYEYITVLDEEKMVYLPTR
jgi:Lrp/AsnC family transcriptional regulator, leucine-responsive regulatory protein